MAEGSVEVFIEVDDGWQRRNEERCEKRGHPYEIHMRGCRCGALTDRLRWLVPASLRHCSVATLRMYA